MINLQHGVKLITRAEWGARPPRSSQGLSATIATGHHVGPTIGSFEHARCYTRMRGIQNHHMDAQGWQDIAYNLVPCSHGYVFEGRGRGRRSAANGTNAGNSSAYAWCYMGGTGDPLTAAGKRACRAAADYLAPGGRRNGHRDWKNTFCPNDVIYAWIRAGLPIAGTAPPPPPKPAPPKPAPPAPTPPKPKDDDMLHLVKGSGRAWYLSTNLVTARHAETAAQAARAIWLQVAAGGVVSMRPGNQPHVLPQEDIDAMLAGREGPRDHATELRAIDIRNELDKLTAEVRAWQAAVDAR